MAKRRHKRRVTSVLRSPTAILVFLIVGVVLVASANIAITSQDQFAAAAKKPAPGTPGGKSPGCGDVTSPGNQICAPREGGKIADYKCPYGKPHPDPKKRETHACAQGKPCQEREEKGKCMQLLCCRADAGDQQKPGGEPPKMPDLPKPPEQKPEEKPQSQNCQQLQPGQPRPPECPSEGSPSANSLDKAFTDLGTSDTGAPSNSWLSNTLANLKSYLGIDDQSALRLGGTSHRVSETSDNSVQTASNNLQTDITGLTPQTSVQVEPTVVQQNPTVNPGSTGEYRQPATTITASNVSSSGVTPSDADRSALLSMLSGLGSSLRNLYNSVWPGGR